MPMVTVMTPPLSDRAGIYGTDCVDREDDGIRLDGSDTG